jgi:hypothetical protein
VIATVSAAVVLPTVSVPNDSLAGLIVSGRSPVPFKLTTCGESGALSLIANEPVRAPETDGLKVTFTWQDAPAFSEDPQVWLKTAKLPVAVIELMLTALELVFFNVTVFDALVVPATCAAKATLNGEGETIGLLATVNGNAANAAQLAPLGKPSTHTWNAPGFLIWAAVTGTLSCVLLMYFTAGNVPFTETTEFAENPVPFRVRVKAALPGTAAAGLRLVSASGVVVML